MIANHEAMSEIYAAIKAEDVQYLMVADRLESRQNLYATDEVKEGDLGSMMGAVSSPAEMDPAKEFHHEIQIQHSKLMDLIQHFRFRFKPPDKL